MIASRQRSSTPLGAWLGIATAAIVLAASVAFGLSMSKPQPTCGPDHGVTTACQHLLATNPAAVPSVIHTNTCGFNHTGQPVCVDYHKVAPKCPAGMICPAELLASYGMIFNSQGYGIIALDYLHPPYVVADGSSMLRQIITRYRQFRPASVDTICVSDHGHAFTGGPESPCLRARRWSTA